MAIECHCPHSIKFGLNPQAPALTASIHTRLLPIGFPLAVKSTAHNQFGGIFPCSVVKGWRMIRNVLNAFRVHTT